MAKATITQTKIPLPFGANAINKNEIPETEISSISNRASYNSGFPTKTFTPVSSGGLPPSGADFNGLLNTITQLLYNMQNGYGIDEYDKTYQVAQGGYGQYATLWYQSSSVGRVLIQSLVANNLQVPYSGTTLQSQWKLAIDIPTVESTDYTPDWTNSYNQLYQSVSLPKNSYTPIKAPFDGWLFLDVKGSDWGNCQLYVIIDGNYKQIGTGDQYRSSGIISISTLVSKGDVFYAKTTGYSGMAYYNFVKYKG